MDRSCWCYCRASGLHSHLFSSESSGSLFSISGWIPPRLTMFIKGCGSNFGCGYLVNASHHLLLSLSAILKLCWAANSSNWSPSKTGSKKVQKKRADLFQMGRRATKPGWERRRRDVWMWGWRCGGGVGESCHKLVWGRGWWEGWGWASSWRWRRSWLMGSGPSPPGLEKKRFSFSVALPVISMTEEVVLKVFFASSPLQLSLRDLWCARRGLKWKKCNCFFSKVQWS